jgi:photosystem II stability/assembly factor-like uncharacterized protein
VQITADFLSLRRGSGGDLELEKQIEAIQRSTKTLFGFFIPVHNWLRMRYKWYYKWHMKTYASPAHWIFLGLYLIISPLAIYSYYHVPTASKADEIIYNFPRWEWKSPLPSGNQLTSLITCKHNVGGTITDVYCLGGKRGTFIWSIDGHTWQHDEDSNDLHQDYTGTTENINSLATNDSAADSFTVAVGDNSTILQYSANLNSWTARTSPLTADKDLTSVYYLGDNKFFANAGSSGIYSTDNGEHWSLSSDIGTAPSKIINLTSNNLLAINGTDTNIYWSNNSGITWHSHSVGKTIKDISTLGSIKAISLATDKNLFAISFSSNNIVLSAFTASPEACTTAEETIGISSTSAAIGCVDNTLFFSINESSVITFINSVHETTWSGSPYIVIDENNLIVMTSYDSQYFTHYQFSSGTGQWTKISSQQVDNGVSGTVYLSTVSEENNYLVLSYSTLEGTDFSNLYNSVNNGVDWSKTGNNGGEFTNYWYESISAYDPSNSDYLVARYYNEWTHRVTFTISTDRGTTWSDLTDLGYVATDNFQPLNDPKYLLHYTNYGDINAGVFNAEDSSISWQSSIDNYIYDYNNNIDLCNIMDNCLSISDFQAISDHSAIATADYCGEVNIWECDNPTAQKLFILTNNGGTWSLDDDYANPVAGYHIASAASLDNEHIVAVGTGGKIITSSNSGIDWTPLTSGTSSNLSKITKVNSTLAVAVGASGAIVEISYDGSFHATPVSPAPTTQNLDSLTVLDDNHLLAYNSAKMDKFVYASQVGGIWSWNEVSTGVNDTMNSTISPDASHIVAVGDGGKIVSSADYGATWTIPNNVGSEDFNKVVKVSSSKIVAVGNSGTVAYSADIGQTWTKPDSDTTDKLNSVAALNETHIIAVGASGAIVRSTDGGASWTLQSNFTDHGLYDIVNTTGTDLNNISAVAVGGNKTIINYYSPANATATKFEIAITDNQTFVEGSGVTGTPATVQAGIDVPAKIYAVDSSGNSRDTTNNSRVSFTTTDPNDYNPGSIQLSEGVGTVNFNFHTATIDKDGQPIHSPWTTTTTDINGFLSSSTSSSIDVTPGDPAKLLVARNSSSELYAGAADSVSLSLTDEFGNITTSTSNTIVSLTTDKDNGRFSTSSTGPWTHELSITIPANTSSINFYYLDYSAETSTITASKTGLDSDTEQFTTKVGGIDALKSSVTISADSVIADNTPITITATLLDSNYNKISGKNIIIYSSKAEDSIDQSNSKTDGNGNASGTIRSLKSGESIITVKDETDNIFISSNPKIYFQAGKAAKIIIAGNPTTTTAGVSFAIQVTAKDSNDNQADSYRETVKFSSSDKQADLPSNYSFEENDQGSHSFSINFKTKGDQSLTITDDSFTSEVNINVLASNLSNKNSGLSLSRNTIRSNSNDSTNAKITLQDIYQNGISDRKPTASSSRNSDNFSSNDSTTDTYGQLVYTVTSSVPGLSNIIAQDESGNTIDTKILYVSTSDPDLSKSSITLDKDSITASGNDVATLNINLKDNQGFVIPRLNLSIESERGNKDKISNLNPATDDFGQSQISITSEESGSTTIKVYTRDTNLLIATLNLDVTSLSLAGKITNTMKNIISSISNNPVAKKIASYTEPIASAVAIISALPIIANVLGSIPSVFNFFSYLSVSTLEALGIKRRRKPWGRVYDAITGKPIDLAIVRIFNDKHKLIETRVTDFEGRFGFLVSKGKYIVSVLKEGFHFPSQIAKTRAEHVNEKYQISSETYFGHPIAVEDNSNVNLDIPIDPIVSHMTASMKFKLILRYITDWTEIFLSYLAKPFLFIGAIISTFNYVVNHTNKNLIMITIYLILFIFLFFKYRRLSESYGQVLDENGKPIVDALISIYDREYNTLRQSDTVDKLGRFHFLVKPGTYYLSVSAPGYNMIKDEKVLKKVIKNKKIHRTYNGANIAYSKPGYVAVDVIMGKDKS